MPQVSREQCAMRLAQPAQHSHVPTPAAAAAYKRGNAYMAARDYRAAIDQFSAAIRDDYHFHAAYIGRGSARLALLDYEEAVLDYGRSITVAPTVPDGWFARGTAYWMLGRLRQAEGELRRAVELSPEDSFYYHRLARVLQDQERGDAAARLYETAYRANPCREWALAGWLGTLQEEPETLRAALSDLGPTDHPVVSYYSGWLAMRAGNYRAAASDLAVALKDGGELVPLSAYWELAVAQRELGDVEEYKKSAHEYYDRTGADIPGVQSQDVPKEFVRAMRDIVLGGGDISSIAFAPNGGWLIVFDGYGFWRYALPAQLESRLLELNREKHRIETVAIRPDGGWVVVYDRNGYAWQGIEAAIVERLRELNQERRHIGLVSLGADKSWTIVYNNLGYTYWGIPAGAGERLKQVNSEGRHDIKVVAIGEDGNWAVAYGHNGHQARGPRAMLDALSDFHKAQQSIDAVAFAPNGGWVVYSKSAAKSMSPHEGH